MALTLITGPTALPLSVDEVKTLCRIEDGAFDAELALLLPAAVSALGEWTGLALGEQTWKLTLDAFADAIELPRGPVLEVLAANFTYVDANGASQQVDPALYTLDLVTEPGWIVRDADAVWPATLDAVNVVSVQFKAGYTTATIAPALKLALAALVKHWWESGIEAGLPDKVTQLAAPWRQMWICA